MHAHCSDGAHPDLPTQLLAPRRARLSPDKARIDPQHFFFFFNDTPPPDISPLPPHAALPFCLALGGLRLGGTRLAAPPPFAWVASPSPQYVSSSNTTAALPPLFLIWGFWLVTSPWARGAAVALSGWTKFAPLLVGPLWASYPDARSRPREKVAFVAAFVAATLVPFSVLLLQPHPLHPVDV